MDLQTYITRTPPVHSFEKRCRRNPVSFTGETTWSKVLRSCSCGKKPHESASSVQAARGKLWFRFPSSDYYSSRSVLRIQTLSGCLVEATSTSKLCTFLQISGDKKATQETIISELDSVKQPRLIVIDNFETPWNGDRKQVGDILRRLAMLSHIAILVTMRENHPPRFVGSNGNRNILNLPMKYPVFGPTMISIQNRKATRMSLLGYY